MTMAKESLQVGDVVDYDQSVADWIKEEIGPGPFELSSVQSDPFLGLQVSLRDSFGRDICGHHGQRPRSFSAAHFRLRL